MPPLTDFFQILVGYLTPLFVITSMANVGLTQKPQKILGYLRQWRYLLHIVIINFTVVPALMYFAVAVTGISPPHSIALIIFSLAAGAPVLIKLAATSNYEVAAGATVQMVLMAATIVVMPLMLPAVIEGVEINPWTIAKPLLIQTLLPLVLGMVVRAASESFCVVVQPWIGRTSNISLYAMLISTLIGYANFLTDPVLWKALLVGIAVLGLSFMVGHGLGDSHAAMSDLGGFGTAQRNTAAAMITAQTGFAHEPQVLVTVAVLNTVMMFVLLGLAKPIGRGNRPAWLEPVGADMPESHAKGKK